MGASVGQSNFGEKGPITALPETGTHINPNGNVSSAGFQQGQHGFRLPFHQQVVRQRERERSRTNGIISERERERERQLANGAIEEQRQLQRTNAAGQTQTPTQERRFRQPLHHQLIRQRHRERSRTNGVISERERERERQLANGVIEEQRQEQRINAAGQTQTRTQERTIEPHQ
jgi:hypothetical protein